MFYGDEGVKSSSRLIEETFPFREISEESAKEKTIRTGHISTLHVWWARRPLTSSRATAYAALVPFSKDDVRDWEKKRQFIIELSKWKNSLRAYPNNTSTEDIVR